MITGKAILKPMEISFRVAEQKETIRVDNRDVEAQIGDYIITSDEGDKVCDPAFFISTYKITKISK